jgi:arginine utilization protein RocB
VTRAFYALSVTLAASAVVKDGWPIVTLAVAALVVAYLAHRDATRAFFERLRKETESARRASETQSATELERLSREMRELEDAVKKLKLAVNLREVTAQSMKA